MHCSSPPMPRGTQPGLPSLRKGCSAAAFAYGGCSPGPRRFPRPAGGCCCAGWEGAAWSAPRRLCIGSSARRESPRWLFLCWRKARTGAGLFCLLLPLKQNQTRFLAASAVTHCLRVRKSRGKPPSLHKTEQTRPPPSRHSCPAACWQGSGTFQALGFSCSDGNRQRHGSPARPHPRPYVGCEGRLAPVWCLAWPWRRAGGVWAGPPQAGKPPGRRPGLPSHPAWVRERDVVGTGACSW